MKRSAYKSRNGFICHACPPGRGGFTLAEAMIAVVVLSIAAAGIILPFTAGASIRAEGIHRTLAARLAADLMEKINNTPFEDIVTNFNYTETQGQVKDYNGVPFASSNYTNFSRQVTCNKVRVTQQDIKAECFFIKATVSVSYKGNELISLTRLIGR